MYRRRLVDSGLVNRLGRSAACMASPHPLSRRNSVTVDAILERPDGTWAAIEIKLNPTSIDAAAKTLLKLANNIDEDRSGQPLALIVVTSTGATYTRSDGIHVVPITMLGV